MLKPGQTDTLEEQCVKKGMRMTDQRRVIAQVIELAEDRGRADVCDGLAVGLDRELAVVATDVAGLGHHPVLEGLDHRPDAGDRGPQVVAHPRHQLAPAAIERPLALGHGGLDKSGIAELTFKDRRR